MIEQKQVIRDSIRPYNDARPSLGGWAWVEMMVMLRNHEKQLAQALVEVGVPNLGAICFYTLMSLYDEAPQMPSALACAVGTPATSFTPVLDRLEELDLIRRGRHPADRRAIYIHLTEGGEALRETLLPIAQKLNTNLWHKARELGL